MRLIVPFAPAGTTDIIARMLAQHLSNAWGQQVVVDNRPGGGTLIAAELVKQAAADGHTLLMGGTSLIINTNAATALSGGSARVDVQRDFAPIILCATGANVVSVRYASPIGTLKDLIALAKAKPGKLTFGSSGVGSSNHLSGEVLKMMAGIDLVHVPYKGNTPALADAAGGQIDMVFAGVPTLQPFLKSRHLRALAIGSKQRFITVPDVPTFEEAGLPGYEMPNFFGLLAPAGTAGYIIAKINRDTQIALTRPEIGQQLIADGANPGGGTPAQFGEF
ncbi:MAG TPA: tripartite tricarboxylate transporter substrate binding protein, partial [Burkholderiales bacterium]|nr:tripartite tricarboxylate transporter substrate binding protein [Burkholderiales bacterium]